MISQKGLEVNPTGPQLLVIIINFTKGSLASHNDLYSRQSNPAAGLRKVLRYGPA